MKQHQFGGKQFQHNMPRALIPSLRTWCDGEGSQVPSVGQAGPRPPPWANGSNRVPIQAGFASGLHFSEDFWRQKAKQVGRQDHLTRQMSFSTVPQAIAPTVCHGFPHPCEVASPPEARPRGRGATEW